MIQSAIALSTQPVPRGNRVAMITNTGGPAILAVDEAMLAGLEMARLAPETTSGLREKLYPEAAVGNPVDVLATATPEHYDAAIEALMKDPNVDSILISFITAQFVDLEGIAATVVRAQRRHHGREIDRSGGTSVSQSYRPVRRAVITLHTLRRAAYRDFDRIANQTF